MSAPKRTIRFEDSKCVWKLECPFCGWLFGLCLDLTDEDLADEVAFLVGGAARIPTRFPKRESDRLFAYFKVQSHVCANCGATLIPEDDFSYWLSSFESGDVDCEDVLALIQETDPEGRLARVCSDRVYDAQFEEWGINGMPSRYLATQDVQGCLERLVYLLRFHE